jgi:hypothetical protein
VKRTPCHHRMKRPQVADGGDTLQLWRVAVNILNKQTRGGPLGWGLGMGPGGLSRAQSNVVQNQISLFCRIRIHH